MVVSSQDNPNLFFRSRRGGVDENAEPKANLYKVPGGFMREARFVRGHRGSGGRGDTVKIVSTYFFLKISRKF